MADIYDKVTARNIKINANAQGEHSLLLKNLSQSSDNVDFDTIECASAINDNGVITLEKCIFKDSESELGETILESIADMSAKIEAQTPFTSDLKEIQLTEFRKDEFLEYTLTRKIISSIGVFASIYEIKTIAQPNQTFDVYINDTLFDFEVKTYESGRSTITIFKNGILLCDEAHFSVCLNLFYFKSDSEAFFFLPTQKLESYNWQNLGKELRLFYGSF